MSRVVFAKGEQRSFLEAVQAKTNLGWDEMASLAGICRLSLYDWRREKYYMSMGEAEKLTEISKVPLPKIIKILPEYWGYYKAAKIGAQRRLQKYGPPGTPEGRRKGGLRSQELRRLFPEKYPRVAQRKKILTPKLSPLLAEFIGIVLGDGQITQYQVAVSLNFKTDKEYINYVKELFKTLFGLETTDKQREENHGVIKASSINLTEHLISLGLCRGNKVQNKVDIPEWIFKNKEYMKGCIRGLIDTDGTISRKNYHAKTLAMQIVLINRSIPLLESARRILKELGFTPSRVSYGKQIYLTRKADVQKYVKEVGFSNRKHLERYQKYLNNHY